MIPNRDGGEDGLRIARFIQERKENTMPDDIPITVSELRVSKKASENTTVIAMTSYDAGYLKRVLEHYMDNNTTAERTREVCGKTLAEISKIVPMN